MKELFQYEDDLYVIHRKIPENQMSPRFYNIDSDDIPKMVKLWVETLRGNCKSIDKVFNKNNTFMFCEKIENAEVI